MFDVCPKDIMGDVYFKNSFLKLYSGSDSIESLTEHGFQHLSAVREIPGEDLEDLETPWGYGGPVATDLDSFWRGIGKWRQRQSDKGRVAEFIRLHPFLNPLAYRGWFDQIRFDRLTVLVDLLESNQLRRKYYTKGTKYSLRYAEKHLTIRSLESGEGYIFKELYEKGLSRNNAKELYYFPLSHFETLISASWSDVRIAEHNGKALAVACFIHSRPFTHYHLSGGSEEARDFFAHHLLVEDAIRRYSNSGYRWMHLGGGRDSSLDDSLLKFKTRFSPHRIAFYTGGLIFDRAAYDNLSRDRRGGFLSYRFQHIPELRDEDTTLRPALKEDFSLFFRLKCDIDNIVWSGYAAPPSWLDLEVWYNGHIKGNSERTILIGESGSRRIGYVYIDQYESHIEMTLGIATSEAGRGMGRSLLTLAIQGLEQKGDKRPIEAWLYEKNYASIKAFEAAGFRKNISRTSKNSNTPLTGDAQKQFCWIRSTVDA